MALSRIMYLSFHCMIRFGLFLVIQLFFLYLIHMSSDFLAHILPPSALHLDLGSSVQSSDVGLFLYLHLLLDEDSMVIFKIVISLTTGQSQFRHPLLHCPGS